MVKELAIYKSAVKRITSNWPAFLEKRKERLVQQERHGIASEKVAENILEDLLTMVVGWPLSTINNQIGYSDLLITSLGIKQLIIEVKRPASLAWNRRAVEIALAQAMRYAAEQRVVCVGVSDGYMFYAADIQNGGLHDRVFVSLDSSIPDKSLWWLSEHGIYRKRDENEGADLRLLPEIENDPPLRPDPDPEALLHPKYKLPESCFAYVGNAADTKTWKLPYRLIDDNIDTKRLPKAVQAILSNYRGVKVSGIDEKAIPDVLVRLAKAAASLGKMPHQSGNTSDIYLQLAGVLKQLDRYKDILS